MSTPAISPDRLAFYSLLINAMPGKHLVLLRLIQRNRQGICPGGLTEFELVHFIVALREYQKGFWKHHQRLWRCLLIPTTMTLKLFELINLVLSAVVGGMYWGPWLALSRSLNTFEPDTFLAIVNRLNQNMAQLMTFLTPIGLLSTLPTLYLTFDSHPTTFYLTLVGFVCFLTALIVTVRIEVPIVMQIVTWNVSAMPQHWQQLRDRWVNFHKVRVISGLAGLICLLAGAIF